jgi:hypothetical protein
VKRTHETTRVLSLIVQAGLVAAMVAVFLIPTSVKVSGAEAGAHVGLGNRISKPSLTDRLLLLSPGGSRQTSTYRRSADGFTAESLFAQDSQLPSSEPSEWLHPPLELPINADRG